MEAAHPTSLTELLFADLDVVTCMPERLTDIASWHEHIPFAFWIVAKLKPRRIVELGVHKGDSYSAFCQAVARANLPSACFGVDTWQGEEHAGKYDESVWQEFSAYHSSRYSGFSKLIRSTFDEALPYFEDGSIDLLHIDGRHLYEDVRHDFESWLGKLSPSAAVLIHDTNVRERDFGVWKYWDELARRYPGRNFEFIHGHGLGIVFPGEFPSTLAQQFGTLEPKEVRQVRSVFSALGRSVAKEAELAHVRKQLLALQDRFTECEQRNSQAATLLSQAHQRIEHLEQCGREAEQASHRTTTSLAQRLESAAADAESAHQDAARLANEVAGLRASTSWRMTSPVRALGNLLKGGRPRT
jgi:hypothetical protein